MSDPVANKMLQPISGNTEKKGNNETKQGDKPANTMGAFDLTSEKAAGDMLSSPVAPTAKRQRTANGYTNSGTASPDDSDDDPFAGLGVTQSKHVTQPTQIIHEGTPQLPSSPKHGSPRYGSPTHDTPRKNVDIQVPASSPFQNMNTNINGGAGTKRTLSGSARGGMIAPAGTSFRPPVKAAPVVIDLDDEDGPTYQGGSSSDEIEETSADIQPSSFRQGSKISMTSSGSSGAGPNFRSLMSTFAHPPSNRVVPQYQSGPARAMPAGEMTLADIIDPSERRRVERVSKMVGPMHSIKSCRAALEKCRGFVDDAARLLVMERKAKTIEIDDESPINKGLAFAKGLAMPKTAFHKPPPPPPATEMRRHLSKPVASIAERYSTQRRKSFVQSNQEDDAVSKPKRKLIQGRRNPEPDTPDRNVVQPKKVEKLHDSDLEEVNGAVFSDGDLDDDDDASGAEPETDYDLEGRVLEYLNTCTQKDLVELVTVDSKIVDFFLEKRPFKTLDDAREVSNAAPTKSGKRSNRAPIGDKIVNNAMDMMGGYEAVDTLVHQCSQLGKPLVEEMQSWGFDVFGAKKAGELEMTSIGEDMHDSGLGTPTSRMSEAGDEEVRVVNAKRKTKFLGKPAIMADSLQLKDYQVVGLNWLTLLYKHNLSCILADDMGLGKTCQVIAFISHLVETGKQGPHLIIVPPSTLENWLREFNNFSPNLAVEPYYGSQAERAEIADRILGDRLGSNGVNVVISTYDFAGKPVDNKFMRRLRPDCCVFDEGHVLKNPNSLKYKGLMKIDCNFRLLLTGTPLQNNLMELAAILSFILPKLFLDLADELKYVFQHKASTKDKDHAALLSKQRVERAKKMLTPFVLRRKKDQVLKHMPKKISSVEYCEMVPAQAELYASFKDRAIERAKIIAEGGKPAKESDSNNHIMQLRKAAIHPMLFRRFFTDKKVNEMCDLLRRHEPAEFKQPRDKILEEMLILSDYQLHLWCRDFPCINKYDVPDKSWMEAGKIDRLVKLVKKFKENGDRVLIFSQFVIVLDILEAVLHTTEIAYTRIDGSTKVNERQTLIDNFRDDESITAFLLSTGAGGTGINLMYANKVIIFDGSFNPQDDVQAENRAHRVGQLREVEVVRLVTKGTIEEAIYNLGQSKLELDSKVAGDDDLEKVAAKMLLESEGMKVGGDEKDGEEKKSEAEKTKA